MSFLVVKRKSLCNVVAALQVLLLLSYLLLNIVTVGEMGTALPLLAGFFIVACADLLSRSWRGYLFIKLHFFVFLLFLAWLSFRVLVDLQDVEYLKQMTVATTGGVLLFFLLGSFVRNALNNITMTTKLGFAKCLLFVYALSSFFLFISFKNRLLDQSDIIYIEGVNGVYQRPGNFLIMLFIMASFLYLSIAAHYQTKKTARLLFWLAVYSGSMLYSVVSSQMIGSNAATANILAIYLMTVVLSFLAYSKSIRLDFLNNNLALPLSRSSINKIIKYSMLIALLGVVVVAVAIQVSGFDLNETRAFGFGVDEDISVNTRMKILNETGVDQMGYSPVWGNVDVARLTTDDAGSTLHNFIPNVIAELGLIGLTVVMLLFVMVAVSLIDVMRRSEKNNIGFMKALLSFWLLFVFIFLFLYANLAVGKEWPVIWFFVGFSVSVFVCEAREKDLEVCAGS